jgi:hypothetical protein
MMSERIHEADCKKHRRFVTIYEPVGGWNAVEYWWNPEGFWEPWQTGCGPYYGTNAKRTAISNAIAWAEAEELPLLVCWSAEEEAAVEQADE